jgi:hypothetical protein
MKLAGQIVKPNGVCGSPASFYRISRISEASYSAVDRQLRQTGGFVLRLTNLLNESVEPVDSQIPVTQCSRTVHEI